MRSRFRGAKRLVVLRLSDLIDRLVNFKAFSTITLHLQFKFFLDRSRTSEQTHLEQADPVLWRVWTVKHHRHELKRDNSCDQNKLVSQNPTLNQKEKTSNALISLLYEDQCRYTKCKRKARGSCYSSWLFYLWTLLFILPRRTLINQERPSWFYIGEDQEGLRTTKTLGFWQGVAYLS